MLNYSELKSGAGVLAQRSGDTNYLVHIGIWINLGLEYLYNIYDYYPELEDTHTFNTADGTEAYSMPNRFAKPFRIYNMTSEKSLTIDTELGYHDANISDINDATEGDPDIARLYGTTGVSTAIASTGDTVQIKSSSASDSTNPIVRITGFLDSARTIVGSENITITSGTPTTYKAGTTTFYEITKVSKSADTTGYITVADSSDNVLVTLDDVDRVHTHRVMKLGLIPDATYSVKVLFKKRFRKLVNDYDYPFVECDNYLMLNAAGYAFSQDKQTQGRAQELWAKAKEALASILTAQQANMGTEYQKKIITSFSQAHRS